MRRVNARIGISLLIALFSMGSFACTKSVPTIKMEDIQGKWMAIAREPGLPGRSGQVGFVIEFFSDHTVMLPSGKRTWSIQEDGQIKIDDPGIVMQGELKDDTLTIATNNEAKVIFQRHK